MTIEFITIGSELLAGLTLNTNTFFVGEKLADVGLTLDRQIAIPDDHDAIVSTIQESLTRADWIIVSGGLGPTNDDITKKALARVFNRQLVFHDDILAMLKERYTRSGRPINPHLETQAVQPSGADFIPNDVGTAVGIVLQEGGRTLVAVPGVPREMRPMIANYIVPRIAEAARVQSGSLMWSTTGWPESRLYDALQQLIADNPQVTVAFLPSELGVRLRFTASGPDRAHTLAHFAEVARPVIADALYAERDVGLEKVVADLLISDNRTVAVAESCTGGLIAKRLTDVPGSSAYMLAGFVTYSNEAKVRDLGVPASLIEAHGAVSEPVAKAMAEGAIARTGANISIAATGIAGPGGGTAEKPVGLVWLALSRRNGSTDSREIRLMGDRELIRVRASQAALTMLLAALQT